MTAPSGQAPAPRPVRPVIVVSFVRAVISLVETGAALYAAINASLANGADMHNAIVAAFIAFTAHGVNHNAGGSPV